MAQQQNALVWDAKKRLSMSTGLQSSWNATCSCLTVVHPVFTRTMSLHRMKSRKRCQFLSSVCIASLHQQPSHQMVKYSALLPSPQNRKELMLSPCTTDFCHNHCLTTTSVLRSCPVLHLTTWGERSYFFGYLTGMWECSLFQAPRDTREGKCKDPGQKFWHV